MPCFNSLMAPRLERCELFYLPTGPWLPVTEEELVEIDDDDLRWQVERIWRGWLPSNKMVGSMPLLIVDDVTFLDDDSRPSVIGSLLSQYGEEMEIVEIIAAHHQYDGGGWILTGSGRYFRIST